MIGYLSCHTCGHVVNCADLIGELCPTFVWKRVTYLDNLQVQYQAAVNMGSLEPPAGWRSSSETISARSASDSRTSLQHTGWRRHKNSRPLRGGCGSCFSHRDTGRILARLHSRELLAHLYDADFLKADIGGLCNQL